MARSKGKMPVIIKILIGLVVFVVVVLLGARLYFRLPVMDYYSASDKEFKIPGLSSGLVPQGIAWDEEDKVFLVTGYQKDGSSTYIWRVDKETGKAKGAVRLLDDFGNNLVVHAGGLSVYGDYVYLASGENAKLIVYDRNEVANSEDGKAVATKGSFDLTAGEEQVKVAFTTVHDGKLIAGEFYRDPNYQTPESHKFTTPAGDYLQAIAFEYEFSDSPDAEFGLKREPVAAYSLPDLSQGMAWKDGKVYISESYGVAFSTIGVYDSNKLESIGSFAGLPLYAFDSASKIKDVKIAPMSEEIEFVDGKMYTMCESASSKYIFGNFTSAYWCYATRMDELLK